MFLHIDPTLLTTLFFVIGIVLGSFGNVLAHRLPAGESIGGRSRCPHCKRVLGPLELVPILSWLFQCARCRGCGSPISVWYPIVECASGVLFVFALIHVQYDPLPALLLAIALWTMLLITVIDVRTQLIPDVLTITLAIAALAYQLIASGTLDITGAFLGIAFLGGQWLISRGRWIGSGDVLLIGALGLLTGNWYMMIIALMVSYIVGAFLSVIFLAAGVIKRHAHVPFGPYLIIGSLIAFLFGEEIMLFFVR